MASGDNGTVFVGAGMTFARIAARARPSSRRSSRRRARSASPQIRNRATIGGNLATASPAGDGIPVLAAYDADVVPLGARRGTRRIPLGELPRRPEANGARAGRADRRRRVAARSTGPARSPRSGTRNAMVIAIASVCLQARRGASTGVRLALGSVAPTVLRARRARRRSRDERSTGSDPGERSPSSGGSRPPRRSRSTTCAARPPTGATSSRCSPAARSSRRLEERC